MHSSVLQNDKYIEFMNDNGVDVIALGRLDEGISKNDPKAAEFDTNRTWATASWSSTPEKSP